MSEKQRLLPRPDRRRAVVSPKTYWGWGWVTFLVLTFAIAAIALGFAAAAYARKSDVSDPLTVNTLTVTGDYDFCDASEAECEWMMPVPPTRRNMNVRSTQIYNVNPGDTQIILGNQGIQYDLRFPKKLSGYVGKEYHIFSNTTEAHTILFTNAIAAPSCAVEYSDTTWDDARKFPLAKFLAEAGAYIHFRVVDCGTVTVIETRNVDFCFENMTVCEHPKRNINAPWADIKDAKITGTLDLSDANVVQPGPRPADPSSPNVILVVIDDMARANTGVYGDPHIQAVTLPGHSTPGGTKNIDSLYNDGVRMHNFHVAPYCAPTRSALITGRYPLRAGSSFPVGLSAFLNASEVTLGDVFTHNGYNTYMSGKWNLGYGPGYRPEDRGYQETFVSILGAGVGEPAEPWNYDFIYNNYFVKNGALRSYPGYLNGTGYVEEVLFDDAINFVERNKDTPFFAHINTLAPHWPYRGPPEYRDAYKAIGVTGIDDLVQTETQIGEQHNNNKHAEYYGMISVVDEQIGRLRTRLEELDLADNTLLIVITDNGIDPTLMQNDPDNLFGPNLDDACNPLGLAFSPYKGTPPHRGGKIVGFEAGHIALSLWNWPSGGLSGGRDVSDLAAHIDLMPTLVDLLDLKLESEQPSFDGISLANPLRGIGAVPSDRTVVVEAAHLFPNTNRIAKYGFVDLMKGDWRLRGSTPPPAYIFAGIQFPWELYNITADPSQTTNLAGTYPSVVTALSAEYEAYWDDVTQNYDPLNRFDRNLLNIGDEDGVTTLLNPGLWDFAPTRAFVANMFGYITADANEGLALPMDAMNTPSPAFIAANVTCYRRNGFIPDRFPVRRYRINMTKPGDYRISLRRHHTSRYYTSPVSVNASLPTDPGNPNNKEYIDFLYPFDAITPITFASYYTEATLQLFDSTDTIIKEWRKPIVTGTEEVSFDVQITTFGKIALHGIFTRVGNDPFTGDPLNPRDAPYMYITRIKK